MLQVISEEEYVAWRLDTTQAAARKVALDAGESDVGLVVMGCCCVVRFVACGVFRFFCVYGSCPAPPVGSYGSCLA
jgi:hypothetical protein